jgi:hypothetical protein
MPFPTALRVLGPALTSVGEGLEAIPDYIDKDEELAQKRALRPLTLEEARLRVQKTRQEIEQPKPISAGAHGSYIFNPETKKYEFDARSATLGGTDTAYMRNLRYLSEMSKSSDPEIARIGKGMLETKAGIKTTAQMQSMDRYFGALSRSEEPLPTDVEVMRLVQNHYVRGNAEGGYQTVNPPMPGAAPPGQQPPPSSPSTPAPGSTPTATPTSAGTPPAGVDSRILRGILGNEGSGEQSVSPRGAVGRFQVMPETARRYLPAGMQQLSTQQIQETLTKSPGLANDIGVKHLANLQSKYPGRPDLVAAAYFSGEDNVKDGKIVNEALSDGNMTVRQYVDRFMQRYGGQSAASPQTPTPAPAPASSPPVGGTAPPPTAPAPGAPSGVPLTGPSPGYLARTTADQRRAQGLPAYTHDEVAMAKRLASRKVIASSDLSSMSDADFTKIQDYLDQKKQEPLFQKRVKEAEPQIGALDSIEMAERVSGDLFPLLNTSTVGLGGLVSRAWTAVGSNLGLIKDPYARQTLQQAVDSTEKLLAMARQRGDIQQVLAENPKAAEALVNPGAQGVQVIAGVLEYLHAAALKKSAAASGRSTITVEDIRRATALFDPTSLYADPVGSKKKIATLQATFLRPEKEVVSKALRLKGIDPVTRKPVRGFHFGSEPGSDVQPKTGKELLDESDEDN